mmetsp:Transcript_3214/g.7308  ORF Transcript_3214/g.7308 Transcript_3214/m.7308 type:complete len:98 (+) Transcript_3214:20-313(+)
MRFGLPRQTEGMLTAPATPSNFGRARRARQKRERAAALAWSIHKTTLQPANAAIDHEGYRVRLRGDLVESVEEPSSSSSSSSHSSSCWSSFCTFGAR